MARSESDEKNAKFRRECKYKASIQAKDAKYKLVIQARGGKDKGFGRTEGKEYKMEKIQNSGDAFRCAGKFSQLQVSQLVVVSIRFTG